MHRLLYVACTRARTELHLFCKLDVKQSKAGMEVVDPRGGTLLRCGWQYLQPIAAEQLPTHGSAVAVMPAKPVPGRLLDLAAGTEAPTQQIKRLPSSWTQTVITPASTEPAETIDHGVRQRAGSLASRARGTVLHALFESLATLEAGDARRNVTQSLNHWRAVASAMLRQVGLHHRELDAELKSVLTILQMTSEDPDAQWILGRRPYAHSESSWTTQEDESLKVMRCDRVFLGGAEPRSQGEDHLWIVDYKTADGDDAFLLDERKRHEPQLQRYAAALRDATQLTLPLRLALYYPALPHLLWWEA